MIFQHAHILSKLSTWCKLHQFLHFFLQHIYDNYLQVLLCVLVSSILTMSPLVVVPWSFFLAYYSPLLSGVPGWTMLLFFWPPFFTSSSSVAWAISNVRATSSAALVCSSALIPAAKSLISFGCSSVSVFVVAVCSSASSQFLLPQYFIHQLQYHGFCLGMVSSLIIMFSCLCFYLSTLISLVTMFFASGCVSSSLPSASASTSLASLTCASLVSSSSFFFCAFVGSDAVAIPSLAPSAVPLNMPSCYSSSVALVLQCSCYFSWVHFFPSPSWLFLPVSSGCTAFASPRILLLNCLWLCAHFLPYLGWCTAILPHLWVSWLQHRWLHWPPIFEVSLKNTFFHDYYWPVFHWCD